MKRDLKENVILNVIYASSLILISLVTFPYLSRVLGPEGTGKVAFARSVVKCFMLFSRLGIPVYGVRAIAKVRDDQRALKKTCLELLVLSVIMDVITLAAYGLTFLIWGRMQVDAGLFIVFAAHIAIDAIGVEWLFQGLEEFRFLTIRSLIIRALYVLGIFLLVHSVGDYVVYAGLIVFAEAAPLVWNLLHLKRAFGQEDSKHMAFKELDIKQHIRPALTFFALSAAAVIFTNQDKVMLGIMTDDVQVGYYDMAIRIKDLLINILEAAGVVLMGRTSYYLAQKDYQQFQQTLRKSLYVTAVFASLMVLVFEFTADVCISILAGAAFEPSVAIMRVILPVLLLFGLGNIFGTSVLVPYGLEKKVFIAQVWGVVLNLALNILLIPRFYALGAAIATVAGQGLVTVIEFIYIRKCVPQVSLKIDWKEPVLDDIITDLWKKIKRHNSINRVIIYIRSMDLKNLYLIGYAIVVAQGSYVLTNWPQNDLMTIAVIGCGLALMVLKVLLDDSWSLIKTVLIMAGAVCILLTTFVTGDFTVAIWYVALICATGVDFRKFLKVHVVVELAVIAVTLVGESFQMLETSVKFWRNGELISNMGFNSHNTLPGLVLFLGMCICVILGERLRAYHVLGIVVVSTVAFKLLDSRTAYYTTLLLCVLMGIELFVRAYGYRFAGVKAFWVDLWRRFGPFSMIACAIVGVGLTYFYGPENTLLARINDMLSNRLLFGKQALEQIPVKLLGNKVEMLGSGVVYFIDCFYVRVVMYGVFTFAIAIGTFIAGLCKNRRNRMLMLIGAVVSIFHIAEYSFFTLAVNPFTIVLFMQVDNSYVRKEKIY